MSPARRRRRRGRGGPARPPREIQEECEAELAIESLAAGGDGVGRLPDGRIAFVRFAAPGDRLRIAYPEVPESKARFVRARIVDILERGPSRTEPVCAVFGRCGGCGWQHIDYPAQLDAKRRILADALRRIGGLSHLPEVEMVASPDPFHYRARTRLRVSSQAVGYRRWKSHEIEPIRSCPILLEGLEVRLGQLAEDHAAGRPCRGGTRGGGVGACRGGGWGGALASAARPGSRDESGAGLGAAPGGARGRARSHRDLSWWILPGKRAAASRASSPRHRSRERRRLGLRPRALRRSGLLHPRPGESLRRGDRRSSPTPRR